MGYLTTESHGFWYARVFSFVILVVLCVFMGNSEFSKSAASPFFLFDVLSSELVKNHLVMETSTIIK